MKKWIKTHSKILISILGIVFIANAIYGLTICTESWQFVMHIFSIVVWPIILLWITGVFDKIFEWWDKD